MKSNYSTALKLVLQFEGGFSDTDGDHGGPTNFGVIQSEYDTYRKRKGLPTRSVRDIGQAEVGDIYHLYWQAVRGDDLPVGVDMILFDTGVNMGTVTAIKMLQRALKVAVDGHLGLQTLGALDNHAALPQVEAAFYAARERRYRSIAKRKGQSKFLKGWLSRLAQLKAAVAAMPKA